MNHPGWSNKRVTIKGIPCYMNLVEVAKVLETEGYSPDSLQVFPDRQRRGCNFGVARFCTLKEALSAEKNISGKVFGGREVTARITNWASSERELEVSKAEMKEFQDFNPENLPMVNELLSLADFARSDYVTQESTSRFGQGISAQFQEKVNIEDSSCSEELKGDQSTQARRTRKMKVFREVVTFTEPVLITTLPIPPLPNIGETVNVVLNAIISSEEIYVQIEDGLSEKLKTVRKAFGSDCTEERLLTFDRVVNLGELVICKFKDSESTFRRGLVLRADISGMQYSVWLIDLGLRVEISFSSVYKPFAELKDLPPTSIRVSLANLLWLPNEPSDNQLGLENQTWQMFVHQKHLALCKTLFSYALGVSLKTDDAKQRKHGIEAVFDMSDYFVSRRLVRVTDPTKRSTRIFGPVLDESAQEVTASSSSTLLKAGGVLGQGPVHVTAGTEKAGDDHDMIVFEDCDVEK